MSDRGRSPLALILAVTWAVACSSKGSGDDRSTDPTDDVDTRVDVGGDGDGDGDETGTGGTGTGTGGGGGTGCTLTQGYWKNHEESWPTASLTLGDVVYGADELLALLGTPVAGDKSLILAHQLIAAMLNVESGAPVPADVAEALAAAHDWLRTHADLDGRLPYGSSGNDGATGIASVLASFNEGDAGVSHCDDGPITPPPVDDSTPDAGTPPQALDAGATDAWFFLE